MKYLNKISNNETEAKVQKYFHSLGFQSIKRGWPDFCFYKKKRGQKTEYVFVEVKRKEEKNIKNYQRKIKNIFKDLGLDYKICFGVLEDGSPNFRKERGLNK